MIVLPTSLFAGEDLIVAETGIHLELFCSGLRSYC
jgi:hypothetical protein